VTKKVYAPDLIILLSAVCLTSIASAQTSWWRTYGGAGTDYGNSVQQTSDGGYMIAGATWSFGADSGAFYLIKTNAHGNMLWSRMYVGPGYCAGLSGQQTSDGGYVITGYVEYSKSEFKDVYLVKTSASGDTLWTRTYGGYVDDWGNSVQQTVDGGYVIAGYTCSYDAGGGDFYVIRTNSQGDTLWTRSYGGTDYDEASSIRQTTDGGYVITGTTNSFGAGYSDIYVVKTNVSGETLWTRTYGGTSNDCGCSVQQTTDGGYIIVGFTASFGSGVYDHVFLIKTDAQGDTLWTRTYGGPLYDAGNSVQQTTDGGYIVAGYAYSSLGQGHDVYLIKTNSQGDTLWTRTYGGTGYDEARSVQQTLDGGYIVSGTYEDSAPDGDDVYLIKTDSLGNVGVAEPLTGHALRPTHFLVRPNPFTSFARVPGHETELFTLSDVTGRQVAVCNGDRIGAGLRPGVYFLSPAGPRAGTSATATIVKTAF